MILWHEERNTPNSQMALDQSNISAKDAINLTESIPQSRSTQQPDLSHLRHSPTLRHGMRDMRYWRHGNWKTRVKSRFRPAFNIDRTPTFKEVYEGFYKEKYRNQLKEGKKTASMYSSQAAFRNSSTLHNMQFGQIRYKDMQDILNDCTLKHSSQELIVSLMHQMYAYAIKYDIVDKDYSASLFIPISDDDEHGVPFTHDELQILWNNKTNPIVEMILIMCYSGFRITEIVKLDVNLEEKYFHGGIKTRYGKDRDVPIYSQIYDMVTHRPQKNMLGCTTPMFRKQMYEKLESLGISTAPTGEKHTPHDCRHTFSVLCEKYKVNENDRKRMLGHSFGADITNGIYGHRTVDDLRKEIEKIKVPFNK